MDILGSSILQSMEKTNIYSNLFDKTSKYVVVWLLKSRNALIIPNFNTLTKFLLFTQWLQSLWCKVKFYINV